MISAIFVDRPRLAIVISVVLTIAGLLSLYVIPIAQYPDIVPPQVSVTTTYPGANASVVDATVAQPIEAQVIGVDKMIYMKSVSGDDGSYSLTVSFELGTDPDINTVNVNNRVQIAMSKLPQDVSRQGVTVKKKSSAILGVIAVYSPKQTHDPLFISNYVTINLLDPIKSTPGVGDASLWGPQDYAMRAWVRTDRLTGLNLTTGDIIAAIQAQNVQAAVGRIGARPISDDQQLQLNLQTKGRLSSVAEFENIVVRTNPDGSVLRLGDVARLELGAANLDRETLFNGCPRRGCRDLPDARRQCDHHAAGGEGQGDRAGEAVSGGPRVEGDLRPHDVRQGHHPRGSEDADRGVRPRRHRRLPVSRQHPCDADTHDRSAGEPDRHLHRALCRSAIPPIRSRCLPWCSPSASWSTTPSSWSRTSNA